MDAAANDLERESLMKAIGNQHLTVTNDFRFPSCKIVHHPLVCLVQTAAAVVAHDDDDDDDASRGDACAGTLVECFEYLTCVLELPVGPSSRHSMFAVECSTVAVEHIVMR